MEKRRRHRYRLVEGKRWIEIRVKSPHQLFDSRDPAPFRDRDLDDDFLAYVASSAREFSHGTPLKIVIYVDAPESPELSAEVIREAIRADFGYRIDTQESELRQFLRRAQLFFGVGVAVLAGCLLLAQQIPVSSTDWTAQTLREGVVIFGWVSVWKPIELILFDWYPLYENIRFYRKLEGTELSVRFTQSSS